MSAMASKITSLTIVYSTFYSGADQRKHQSSVPLAFVRGIHRWPVNSPHKGPVMRNAWRHQAITWNNVGISLVRSSHSIDIQVMAISQNIPLSPIFKINLKITDLKLC